MGKIIGIDLGTTFSAVAQLDDTGRAVIVHNQEGENITASAVEFVSDELIYVGSEAKKSLGTDSKNVLEKFKIENSFYGRIEGNGECSKPSLNYKFVEEIKN